ncbi:hypothetical protein [Pedobacter antarcticus]|uniref:hypothetical protein n=1 Tax=Pedobacter antarcticus TaxID=34086 RepID=UPI00088E5371|nr:hypothetical protein [Pedobacter antarcticus]SDM40730.1 hypothetical protein SAMN04488084_106175 [Pedobacter antarcticus]
MSNIEEKSITIGLKMLWAIVVGLLVSSFSLAGIYFSLKAGLQDNKYEIRQYKADQSTINAIQTLSMENMKLNLQKLEIEVQEINKKANNK